MLSRLIRPQSALRAASAIPKKLFQTRELHMVPKLTYQLPFETDGINGLMSTGAFDFSWTQYQSLMVEKLNLLTQDTPDAESSPSDLMIKYSRRPEMASVFNYASMAHNNHFFFNCLSPIQTQIPAEFEKDINDTCSSVESLKLDFLATANAMFGPGFVWLAKNLEREGLMHIFCTYNAGSPYPAVHARRQSVDMATHAPDAPMGNQHAGSMGAHSANQKSLAPGAVDLHPILCVNTWEHAWMMDYGVAGKAEYLERWWDRINWEVVHDNFRSVNSKRRAGISRERSLNIMR